MVCAPGDGVLYGTETVYDKHYFIDGRPKLDVEGPIIPTPMTTEVSKYW